MPQQSGFVDEFDQAMAAATRAFASWAFLARAAVMRASI